MCAIASYPFTLTEGWVSWQTFVLVTELEFKAYTVFTEWPLQRSGKDLPISDPQSQRKWSFALSLSLECAKREDGVNLLKGIASAGGQVSFFYRNCVAWVFLTRIQIQTSKAVGQLEYSMLTKIATLFPVQRTIDLATTGLGRIFRVFHGGHFASCTDAGDTLGG